MLKMIILGLGSNIGDRLAHLRRAIFLIKQLDTLRVEKVSPLYLSNALLPENAPKEWQQSYLNCAIQCSTPFDPFELLKILKHIEQQMGRNEPTLNWSPRIIDIDILIWNDLVLQTEVLTIPHAHLLERPFALWPVADLIPQAIYPKIGETQEKTFAEIASKWSSRFNGNAPLQTKQIYHRIEGPQLMGILNVTPDSFSDGGAFIHPELALQKSLELVASGAEILDIGAESTSPQAQTLDPITEWQRLQPVLQLIYAAKNDFLIFPKISIDTRHPETAQQVLKNYNIDCINDVGGLCNQEMQAILSATQIDCIIMHHLTIPAQKCHVLLPHLDAVKEIYDWGMRHLNYLEQKGITRERIIFDPGIGFGKTAPHSLALIKNAQQFTQLGCRTLIGHSRKSFFSLFTDHPFSERDIETFTTALYLATQNITYLRIHNVEACARAFRVWASLK